MKKWSLLIGVLCALNAMSQENMMLEWSFFHPLKKSWMELGEKGSVQEALIETGEMPDPFFGTNETKFGWFEAHDWEFKSLFFISKEMFAKEYIELEFGSVDTYAKFYLNDSLILETANAYIPHRVFIQDIAKEGLNELHVVIVPPVRYHAETYKKMGYKLPAPNDVHENAIAPLTRKPQYQFGWDWALRLNTIGFNKPAQVFAYDGNRVLWTTARTISLEETTAEMEFEVEFAVKKTQEITWKSKQFGTEDLMMRDGRLVRKQTIDNPQLWWPRGQGEQHIYADAWTFIDGKTKIVENEVKFGIKTAELIQEKDQWGTSYYFKINGRTIFCKGADYIPQDIFPARVKEADIRKMVEDMAESNFNMVRVWGGGYYPDEVFFNACDELGIMVWEDLMFACAMYPGNDVFIENITEEFEYQIPRIGGHPSVVFFNGNNEVEVAWGNWGFQIKYGLYGKSAKEIEEAYDRIFKKVAPSVVENFTTIPYIHTSPLSNWGKDEFYNHGSQHYWGVWHGKDPIEDFGKKIGRFNAEYGFQSFPEYSTIRMFSDAGDWDLGSEVMKHHQKSYVGNDMILKHAKKLYGNPANFEEFVYFSQLTQSMAVSMAVAGHRVDFPRCGGTIYWQLNDCWPAPSWSSIDYYGNWKALQYQMKKDYTELSVVAKYTNLETIDYYLVSNLVDTFMVDIQCDVYDLQGKHKTTLELSQMMNGQGSTKLCLKGIEKELSAQNLQLVFRFKDRDGKKHTRTFDNLKSTYQKATEKDVEMTFETDKSGRGQITITNKAFVRNLWVSSNKLGVKFDRNFESLLPGTHTIQITFKGELNEEDFKLMWL